MFELKIKTPGDTPYGKAVVNNKGEYPFSNHSFDVRTMLEYVSGLMESGITSGILLDEHGKKIGEWRFS